MVEVVSDVLGCEYLVAAVGNLLPSVAHFSSRPCHRMSGRWCRGRFEKRYSCFPRRVVNLLEGNVFGGA